MQVRILSFEVIGFRFAFIFYYISQKLEWRRRQYLRFVM